MDKKTLILLILVIALIATVVIVLNPKKPQNPLTTPLALTQKQAIQAVPSDTLKQYSDPSGFEFDYPDNLSLENLATDDSTYANIQLTSKEVPGSLTLKIADTKLKSTDEWVKQNNYTQPVAQTKLGNLNAIEIRLGDKIELAALDQGILFTLEVSLTNNPNFWTKVYDKTIADFSFVAPTQANKAGTGGTSSSSDVTFEGEEVVE